MMSDESELILPKIDKNIPPPARNRREKYPFKDMGVGDSFFCQRARSASILNCARKYRPWTFTTRTVVENGVRGIRTWRIS